MSVLRITGGLLVWTVVAVLSCLALGKVLGRAGEAEHHGPAGWRHATELRLLRDTGPCVRRRVLDPPGSSALASSKLAAVSAAVRAAPAASSGR